MTASVSAVRVLHGRVPQRSSHGVTILRIVTCAVGRFRRGGFSRRNLIRGCRSRRCFRYVVLQVSFTMIASESAVRGNHARILARSNEWVTDGTVGLLSKVSCSVYRRVYWCGRKMHVLSFVFDVCRLDFSSTKPWSCTIFESFECSYHGGIFLLTGKGRKFGRVESWGVD